jgi:membrane associated rhomboid family serine protease
MIPLRDRNPSATIPFVNFVLIGINLAVFIYELTLGDDVGSLFMQYGVIPRDVVFALSGTPVDPRPLLTLFTSMFLHGGWVHLIGNMLYLWVFGDNIEDKVGHGRYLIFYVVCGICATGLQVALGPNATLPTVGASGAISGVLAAYLIMFPKVRVLTIIPIFIFLQTAELPAVVVLGMWFVIQFFNGLATVGRAEMGGVAWWAHIGGFIAGLLLIFPFRRR